MTSIRATCLAAFLMAPGPFILADGGEGEGEGESEGVCGSPSQACCLPGDRPGCSDADCCLAICSFDPFCCDVQWDHICADESCDEPFCNEKNCEPCGGGTLCNAWFCDGDANGDGVVDPLDSGYILARFGLDPCQEGCGPDVNCDGFIDVLDSGYALSRIGTCDEPPFCKPRYCPVLFDHCADAPVYSLTPGSSVTVEGNNEGADLECSALGYSETWTAVTTDTTMDITYSLCRTSPPFGNAFIVAEDHCPCDGIFRFANSWNNSDCGDGNWTVYYSGVPAGTWYFPVLSDSGSTGNYVVTISGGVGR